MCKVRPPLLDSVIPVTGASYPILFLGPIHTGENCKGVYCRGWRSEGSSWNPASHSLWNSHVADVENETQRHNTVCPRPLKDSWDAGPDSSRFQCQAVTPPSPSPSRIPQPSPEGSDLAVCCLWRSADHLTRPGFVLQPLGLPPASGDQKGTEQVPVPLNGATLA